MLVEILLFFSRSIINSNIIIREKKERGREEKKSRDDDWGVWKRNVVSTIYSYIYIFYLFSFDSLINDFN